MNQLSPTPGIRRPAPSKMEGTMAKPYPEGAGWGYRLRVAGQDLYRSGFDTEASARRDMGQRKAELTGGPAPSSLGPYRTSLGAAFSNYACERLSYLKGARQDSNRINSYLRALGLPIVQLTPGDLMKDGKCVYWQVTLHKEPTRTIPRITDRAPEKPEPASEKDLNSFEATGRLHQKVRNLAHLLVFEVVGDGMQRRHIGAHLQFRPGRQFR